MKGNGEVILGVGDLHFGAAPARIRTLLGSCVAITLWHPERRLGGMCHFMLPSRRRGVEQPLDGRYADEALALFQREIERHGTVPAEYRAKLFGGGNMFPNRAAPSERFDIGRRNIDTARRLLAAHHIPVVAEHLGGGSHRRLVFDLGTGAAWLAFNNVIELPPRSGPCPPSAS